MTRKSVLGGLVALSAISALACVARAPDDGGGSGSLSVEDQAKADAAAFLASQGGTPPTSTGAPTPEAEKPKARGGKKAKADSDDDTGDVGYGGAGENTKGYDPVGYDPVSYRPSDYDVRGNALHLAVQLEHGRVKNAQIGTVLENARELEKYLRGDAV